MPPKSKTPKKRENGKQTPVVEEKFQQVDISTKDPRTVVLMLDSPEAVLVCKACDSLHKYMSKGDEKCQELKEIGVVPHLVRLLSSVDKAVRSYAILCLASMTTNSSVRALLLKCESVPSLLGLLHSDEELITQERASFTLAQITVEYSFKIQLHQHSAHDPLLRLLSSSDADVQRNSIQTLSLLVENYQSRPAVLEAGGIPIILELLNSDYAIVQELALKTLHLCMHHVGCRKSVISGDGLAKIVYFLGQKDTSDLHAQAVAVLVLCLEEADCLVALQSSDCLQQLLSNIKESSNQDMKRNSAKALALAANDSVNLKLLFEQEAEKTFLHLLSNEDNGVVLAGCEGLTAMSALNVSQQRIAAHDGLSALVQNTENETGQVRVGAVRAIAAVINGSPANCKLLGSSGGIEAIVRLLADDECGCRKFATNCIASMAPDSSLRSELISEGAIGVLVQCLSFADSAVQSGACVAIGMLACDTSARQEFASSESGVLALLGLVHSSVGSVVQNAIWTISVCAQSSTVSEAICRLGGLELIQKLITSSNEHKSTAKAALNKLVSSNLSAKYWISGRLSQNDVITDMEFFDAGLLLSSSHIFIPLSELVKNPLNKNQAILTINLLAKPQPATEEKADPINQLDASNSTVSTTGGRSKSRQQGGGATERGRGKRGRNEREGESRISEESVELDKPTPNSLVQPGLLPVDAGLWTHIIYTQNHIQILPSVKQQVVELAKYVSDKLGGVIKRSGSVGYELPTGEIQFQQKTNLLPLGEVHVGSFQHRALLFKVLCDQLGVCCSLVRGEYGRHWNEVWLTSEKQNTSQYLVDLTFEPGKLMLANTSDAVQYQRLC